MTVTELSEVLQEFPPDMEVCGTTVRTMAGGSGVVGGGRTATRMKRVREEDP